MLNIYPDLAIMPLKGDKLGYFASYNDSDPNRIEVIDKSMNNDING